MTVFNSIRGPMIRSQIIRCLEVQRLNNVRAKCPVKETFRKDKIRHQPEGYAGEAVRKGRDLKTGWAGRTRHVLRMGQEHPSGEEGW